jgi:DNA-binding response OmpR family regulator
MPAARTVLVIDDDPDIRDAVRDVLQDRGLTVVCAPNGEAGLVRAAADRPDVVIVDMMMPGISGFMVLERLKRQSRVRIPVIMLSGNESGYQRAYAEFLGVDHFLNKPVGAAILFDTVQKLLPVQQTLSP